MLHTCKYLSHNVLFIMGQWKCFLQQAVIVNPNIASQPGWSKQSIHLASDTTFCVVIWLNFPVDIWTYIIFCTWTYSWKQSMQNLKYLIGVSKNLPQMTNTKPLIIGKSKVCIFIKGVGGGVQK